MAVSHAVDPTRRRVRGGSIDNQLCHCHIRRHFKNQEPEYQWYIPGSYGFHTVHEHGPAPAAASPSDDRARGSRRRLPTTTGMQQQAHLEERVKVQGHEAVVVTVDHSEHALQV